MKKLLFLSSFLLFGFLFVEGASADVIPVGTTPVPVCVRLTNLESFTGSGKTMRVYAVTESISPRAIIDAHQVTESECVAPYGYKLNPFALYVMGNVENFDTILPDLKTREGWEGSSYVSPFIEEITSGYLYETTPTTLEKIEEEYHLLGFRDGKMGVLLVSKKIFYKDGRIKAELLPTPTNLEEYIPQFPSMPFDLPNIEELFATPFVDIQESFAKLHITRLFMLGIVSGRSEGYFEPKGTLNRAEALKLITTAYFGNSQVHEKYNTWLTNNPEYVYVLFQDVLKDQWFAPYIYTGVVQGMLAEKELFHPSDLVNRAEFLKMVLEALQQQTEFDIGTSAAKFLDEKQGAQVLTDVVEEAWYAPYVHAAAYEKIIDGGAFYFFPDRALSREEAAKILSLALDL